MSDNDHSNSSEQQINLLLANAQQALSEIEAAKQKAQSEALFAFQAKQNCEEHSTFIAQKKGQVEADLTAITGNRKTIEEFAAAVPLTKATAERELEAISKRRAEADEALVTIAERKQKSDSDATATKDIRNAAAEVATAIRGLQQNAQAATDTIAANTIASTANAAGSAKLVAEMAQEQATASKQLELIGKTETATAELLVKARQNVSDNEAVLEQLRQGHRKYVVLMDVLGKLQEESKRLRDQVEELLPGATSAALASSFRQQAERFKWPKRSWISCFIVCILGLIAVAFPAFLEQLRTGSHATWDSLLLDFVHRLPILVPLVWLAIYAARNYMMAVRLEEDYAYKEAVSQAFEGYKEQMQAITVTGDGDNPLLVLCNNVLKALAERPGRIYEGPHHDITPTNVAMENAAEGVNQLKDKTVAK